MYYVPTYFMVVFCMELQCASRCCGCCDGSNSQWVVFIFYQRGLGRRGLTHPCKNLTTTQIQNVTFKQKFIEEQIPFGGSILIQQNIIVPNYCGVDFFLNAGTRIETTKQPLNQKNILEYTNNTIIKEIDTSFVAKRIIEIGPCVSE